MKSSFAEGATADEECDATGADGSYGDGYLISIMRGLCTG